MAKQEGTKLALLKAKLLLEVNKLERDKEVLDKWRDEWRLSVADYSEEKMIAENVEKEYEINNERGIKRINRRRSIIEQLELQVIEFQ